MPNFKKIFRHIGHYGIRSTAGLVYEKLFTDPKRFSANKKRILPKFPIDYRHKQPAKELFADRHLNILYLIHYFYPTKKGGTERFTLNLAKEQQLLGNDVTVLVLDANEPMSAYTENNGNIYYRRYIYEGVTCIGFRHKKAPSGLYYKNVRTDDTEMAEFAKFITKELKTDIVHATYPQPFASFLYACSEMGIPYIATCTDFAMMCHYSTMVDKKGDFCNGTCGQTKCQKICKTYGCKDFSARHGNANLILKNAKAVTVPSEFVARLLGAEFPEVEILPVAHGISESFVFNKRSGKIKKFVYAGTLSSLKGVHLLIDSFTRLGGDITLDIYGEGDDNYISKLKSLSDSRVKFHGAAPGSEMPKIYAEADCVIVPSMWYETYNFVFREALASGAFVLVSDIGAMSEGVDSGKNGYLFTPADKEDLYKKMCLALEFDFDDYEKRSFPTISEEGKIYYEIYKSSLSEG